ncbi:hypothetical protein L2E82_15394 [Cichorium intybus]|uniref:Uncharacterized protein n=1 Tax=Cichorium intybus TaxID=13427 RepID=A0ACB9F2M4_CICIN|nr:hypothetical protein L2E82_15394 [Cichorium intybus]
MDTENHRFSLPVTPCSDVSFIIPTKEISSLHHTLHITLIFLCFLFSFFRFLSLFLSLVLQSLPPSYT